MIALDAVRPIPTGPMQNARHRRGQRWRIGSGLVGDDPTWRRAAVGDRPLEEAARRRHVACRRHIGVHYLAVLVDGAIDVVPAAADPSIGLVDSPVLTDRRSKLASCLAKQRQIALHPAKDGALIDKDAAFGQPFANFRVTKAVAHIPASGEGNNVVRKGAARERRTRASGEATTALATTEPLTAQLGGPILGHHHGLAARARHQQVLLSSGYAAPSCCKRTGEATRYRARRAAASRYFAEIGEAAPVERTEISSRDQLE